MKLLVHLAPAAVLPAVSLAQANNGYVGIYSDSLGTAACALVPPLTGTTLYVIAKTSGGSADGITGAEFRIEVTNPAGWFFTYTAPGAANIAMGNPIDTDPDPDAGGGLNLGFPSCQVPSGSGQIRLGTLSVFNLSGGPTQLLVKRHSQPSNFGFHCALFVRCDQYYSFVCMTPSPPDSCTLGTQKARVIANDDSAVFTSSLNDGGASTVGPPRDPDREVLAMFVTGVIQLPEGRTHAELAGTTINSPGVESILVSYSVASIAKTYPDFEPADALAVGRAGEVVRLQDLSDIYTLLLPEGGDNAALADELTALAEDVVYAEPNQSPTFNSCPTDGMFGLQWSLDNTGATTPSQPSCTSGADIDFCNAFSITPGSASTKIAIIDSGVGPHNELLGKVVGDDDTDLAIEGGHGTHVAGIVAAYTNTSGIAGVDGAARIVSVFKASNDVAASGLRSAVKDHGAAVHNHSWQGIGASTDIRGAFRDAYMMNSTGVVSAPLGTNVYPGNYPNVIAVGMTDCDDEYPAETNYDPGPNVDVAAPGVDIWSTVPAVTHPTGEWYAYKSGTSQAAPQVSGLAGLLLAVDPGLYNDDIEQLIRLSAEDVNFDVAPGRDDSLGTGRINAYKALELLEAPNILLRDTATGGTPVDSTAQYTLFFFVPPDTLYAKGTYRVRRFEVREDVVFPVVFDSIPAVWGRGVATTGYMDESPSWSMGWCQPVASSVTASGCTLQTYVYEVKTNAVPSTFIGWWPARPDSVVFAYSALGTSEVTDVEGAPLAASQAGFRCWTPNPLRIGAKIAFSSPRGGNVRIDLFDVAGRRVRILHAGSVFQGRHELRWNGKSENGDALAAGLYFMRFASESDTITRKLVVVK